MGGRRRDVLQNKQCSTTANIWGQKEVFPCCNDAIQFLGYILKCIALAENKEGKGGGKTTLNAILESIM